MNKQESALNTRFYSIFDTKAKSFGAIFPAVNDDTAIRMCRSFCRDNPNYADYAEDYELHYLFDITLSDGVVVQDMQYLVTKFSDLKL